jgi:hypothetical protein
MTWCEGIQITVLSYLENVLISELDEIKQQLENTIGTEALQQKLVRARSRVSESDTASLSGEKQSLSESLNR